MQNFDQSREVELLAVSEKATETLKYGKPRDRPFALKKLSGIRTRPRQLASDSKRPKLKPQMNRLPSMDSDKQKSENQQT